MSGLHRRLLSLGLASRLALGLAAASPEWGSNYDAALAAAMSQRRPTLVLFDGPSTSAKQQNLLGALLDNDAFAKFIARQCILCRLPAPGQGNGPDVERQNRQIRANLGVDSLPAILLLDPDGRTLGSPRLRANQRPAEVIDEIHDLIPESLRLPETNGAPTAPRGPLTVDLTAPSDRPTAAQTIDLRALRNSPAPAPHPSLIVLPPRGKPETNRLNTPLPP